MKKVDRINTSKHKQKFAHLGNERSFSDPRRLTFKRFKPHGGSDADGSHDGRGTREDRIRRSQRLLEHAKPFGSRTQIRQIDDLQLERRHRVPDLQMLRDDPPNGRALRLVIG